MMTVYANSLHQYWLNWIYLWRAKALLCKIITHALSVASPRCMLLITVNSRAIKRYFFVVEVFKRLRGPCVIRSAKGRKHNNSRNLNASTILKRTFCATAISTVVLCSHCHRPINLLRPVKTYRLRLENSFGAQNRQNCLQKVPHEHPYGFCIGNSNVSSCFTTCCSLAVCALRRERRVAPFRFVNESFRALAAALNLNIETRIWLDLQSTLFLVFTVETARPLALTSSKDSTVLSNLHTKHSLMIKYQISDRRVCTPLV